MYINIFNFCFNCLHTHSVNSVTPTAMKNVLKRVSGTLNSVACDMLHILQEHIDEIHCNSIGDVRNAILNLIFISLKGMIVIN